MLAAVPETTPETVLMPTPVPVQSTSTSTDTESDTIPVQSDIKREKLAAVPETTPETTPKPKLVVKLRPPKLSDNLKKQRSKKSVNKPPAKPEKIVKITSMFKPIPSKTIPPSEVAINRVTPERAPPTPNLSMGRKNKCEARELRKLESSGLFTQQKDTCELTTILAPILAVLGTKENGINPDNLVNLPDTCQDGQIRQQNEKESEFQELGGKPDQDKAD